MGAAARLSAQDIASRLDELPTLPTIVYELSRVINDPMSSTSEIEKIMSSDPSMTTKVLKLANSAYYAIPGGVASLQRAIAYIGYDAIHQLVLSSSVIKALEVKPGSAFDAVSFWKHSIGVAMAAELIAKRVGTKNPGDFFTMGLIHDMGKIALHLVEPDLFDSAMKLAKENSLNLFEAELKFDLLRHGTVGQLLAQKWKLPISMQAAVAHHHHRDVETRGPLSAELNRAVDIVFLANILIHALQFGQPGPGRPVGIPREALDRLALPAEAVKELIEKLRQQLATADAFLKVIGSP
jgi:putative nucleotidyltransferase with HDIG domain